ncbi:MAG TPA: DUF1080 domain-containing protein [Pirellulaceae bacterium]|nr:DUF1080 domain-containing protein [Pirellulaceae bacterium]
MNLALLVALLWCCICNSVLAQIRSETIRIFDGHSLNGWVTAGGEPAKGNWVAADGVLHRASAGGDLYYQHPVGDFELRFEWKIAPQGNSGVKYRVQQYGNQWLGCEYQIQDDRGEELNVHATGSIYALYEPNRLKLQQPVGEWNVSRIVVFQNRVEHWLNGRLIVEAYPGSSDWRERVKRSKFAPHAGFGENQVGRIFLQDHGTEVWFRNLELTHLSSVCHEAHRAHVQPACCGRPVLFTRGPRVFAPRIGVIRRR